MKKAGLFLKYNIPFRIAVVITWSVMAVLSAIKYNDKHLNTDKFILILWCVVTLFSIYNLIVAIRAKQGRNIFNGR